MFEEASPTEQPKIQNRIEENQELFEEVSPTAKQEIQEIQDI